jgi:hypothetical protein
MSCTDYRRILPEIPDLDPSDPVFRAFEAHRASCEACEAAWRSQEALLGAFRGLEAPAAPPSLAAAVSRRIAAERTPNVRRTSNLVHLAAAAALVATAGIVIALVARESLIPPGNQQAVASVQEAESVDVRVSRAPEGIRVTWSEREGDSFRVLHSERPDAWHEAPSEIVASREWTDPATAASPRLTFYRVEAIRKQVQ